MPLIHLDAASLPEHDLGAVRISSEIRRDDNLVHKTYRGPDPAARLEIEARALRAAGVVTVVPRVKEVIGEDTLVYEYLPGQPADQCLDLKRSTRVLTALGRTLAAIHAAPIAALGAQPDDGVLVHGDFGPHSVLLDSATLMVTGVVDWQWARIGRPIDDLAWCEWALRTFHPGCVDAIPHLYRAYGIAKPSWPRRHRAMLATCRARQAFAARSRDGSASRWQRRVAITYAWRAE